MSARGTMLLLFLINLLNFYDRQILFAVAEPVRREFALSDSALGLLGTAFTLFYAAVGLPLGRLADTWARPRVIALGVGVWSAFTAASGLATSFWMLFAARMGVGFGEASCSPASNSLIGDLFPPDRRARAIAVFMLGLPIGIFLSNVLSGLIAVSYGWRMAFFAATLPGVVLALLAARIQDPTRGAAIRGTGIRGAASAESTRPSTGAPGTWDAYRTLWRIPTLRWIVVSGALHNFNAYAVSAFMPAYLMRYHGLSLARANLVAAVSLGAVGIIGLVAGGMLADAARRRRRNGRLLLGAWGLLLSTPLAYLALTTPAGDVTRFMIFMGAAWVLFYLYYVTVYPTVHDVVPPELRGTAMSVYFFWMYVLGGAFGTTILGMLSDHFARRAAATESVITTGVATLSDQARATGLHDAFFVVPVLSVLLAAVLFLAARSAGRDVQIDHISIAP